MDVVKIETGPLSNFPAENIVSTMPVKKDLNGLHATDLDLPTRTKPYINDSACSYYRGLWNETRKLC